VSSVSAYLALRQAALILHHPDDLSKEKFVYIEQLSQAQSHLVASQGELNVIKEKYKSVTQKVVQLEEALRIACEEEQQLRIDIEAKSTLMATIEKQVIEKE